MSIGSVVGAESSEGPAPLKPPRLVSPADIGRANRARVIQALCDYGPLSRADLARLANVPRATIGGIVQPLVDSDILEEVEPATPATGGGKRPRPLWFRPRAGLTATAYLDDGTCHAALVDARGEILDSAEGAVTHDDDPAGEQHLAVVAATIKSVLPAPGSLIGVGVAVPGVCDSERGVVVGSVRVPGWANFPLAQRLAGLLGSEVFIDNDARCQALGEKWFGAGRGVSTFASIQTGEGLGVGLVVDGTIFRGEGGLTGELGHTAVELEGEPCPCGLHGCWETVANLTWLRARAAAEGFPDPEGMTSERLSALVDAGNATAAAVRDRYAANLAAGLSTLVNLLNPQRLILHGDVTRGGDGMLAAIRRHTEGRVLPHLRPGLDLQASVLDERASLVGAAGLVLSERFQLVA